MATRTEEEGLGSSSLYVIKLLYNDTGLTGYAKRIVRNYMDHTFHLSQAQKMTRKAALKLLLDWHYGRRHSFTMSMEEYPSDFKLVWQYELHNSNI